MDEEIWTDEGALAVVAADALVDALVAVGARVLGNRLTGSGKDIRVEMAFVSMRDAETMLTLAVPSDMRPGTVYDRASAGCVSLNEMIDHGVEPDTEDLARIQQVSWQWNVHPDIVARHVDWHVSVSVPHKDAATVAAALNAARGVL
jgi:hypothetical protein